MRISNQFTYKSNNTLGTKINLRHSELLRNDSNNSVYFGNLNPVTPKKVTGNTIKKIIIGAVATVSVLGIGLTSLGCDPKNDDKINTIDKDDMSRRRVKNEWNRITNELDKKRGYSVNHEQYSQEDIDNYNRAIEQFNQQLQQDELNNQIRQQKATEEMIQQNKRALQMQKDMDRIFVPE